MLVNWLFSPKVTLVKEEHLENAPKPMLVSWLFSPKVTLVKEEQPENA